MTELTQPQLSQLMKRFPDFELSYETLAHKKVSTIYNVAIAIPTGKKAYAWFTFHQNTNVCYIFDLNKDKRIVKATCIDYSASGLELGTILYGSVIHDEHGHLTFLLEDVCYFKGISLKKSSTFDKLDFTGQIMEAIHDTTNATTNANANANTNKSFIQFALPIIWEVKLDSSTEEYPNTLPSGMVTYPVHHIQYRSCFEISPYLNVFLNRKTSSSSTTIATTTTNAIQKINNSNMSAHVRMDFSKPQYKYPTVFQITADIQYDIYHLFAYGKNKQPVYYNLAYIPNCECSCLMNGLFRNIRENKNLDYIEESDDEDDFQNLEETKYVDIQKTLLMECVFNYKFKKWIPIRVMDHRSKVVHISQL